jgi:hypothetical protein
MRGFKDALGGQGTAPVATDTTPAASAQPALVAQAPVAPIAAVQTAPQPLGEKLPAA